MRKKVYLVLENGKVFEGVSFGAEVESVGELIFSTSMVGYVETLTDPSYFGQIVCQTFPLIGNYGVMESDFQSEKAYLSAYIVREWCQEPSNFRSEGNLDAFLKRLGIPGICGIDTRELTRILRENGTMNAVVTPNPDTVDMTALKNFKVADAVAAVTSREFSYEGKGTRIALWDFGTVRNVKTELLDRGCEVVTVPAQTSAEQICALKPDSVFLSAGPGNPEDCSGIINEVAALSMRKIPVLGIGLGHQLLALARGGKVEKMKFSHCGAQPVIEASTGKVLITAQHHGYCVSARPPASEISHKNANDNSCEGLEYTDIPAFSVQFIPETAIGPQSTGAVYDRFVEMAKGAVK